MSLGHKVIGGGVLCLGSEVVGESVGCGGGVSFWEGSASVGLISLNVFLEGGSAVSSSGFFLLSGVGSFCIGCWGSIVAGGWSGSGDVFWEGSAEGVGGVGGILVAAFTSFRLFPFISAFFSLSLSLKAFFWAGVGFGMGTVVRGSTAVGILARWLLSGRFSEVSLGKP